MKILWGMVFLSFVLFEMLFCENISDKIVYLYTSGKVTLLLFYLVVSFLGFLSISMIFFIRNRILYLFFFGFLLMTYAIEFVYKNINSIGFSLNDLTVALAEVDAFAIDALKTYAIAFEKTAFILLLIIIFSYFIRKIVHNSKFYISLKWFLSLFIIASLLSYFLFFRTLGQTQSRPTSFKISTIISYFATNSLYYGERQVLKKELIATSKYQNIILIVDESIGGKYLSINGYNKETTPYLKSIKNQYINLGLASSTANCSASSNILLMSGIQLNELPDNANNVLKKPNIFQYAKKAGYTTHYISGQSINNRLQNYMSKFDLQYIDDFSQPKEEYRHKKIPEEEVVLATKKALKGSAKNFIYIVKHGAHFQWEKSYPQSEQYFFPTLGSKDALSLEKKSEALNSYLNAIRYNVDLFFKEFLNKVNCLERDDTLIIYTSDHGQSILEQGRIATHCDSTNPPLSQGIVPLLIFHPKDDTLIGNFNFKQNIYSHYEIVPSIKKLMGYEVEAETFFDVKENNYTQKFVSGDIFGRTSLEFNDINTK